MDIVPTTVAAVTNGDVENGLLPSSLQQLECLICDGTGLTGAFCEQPHQVQAVNSGVSSSTSTDLEFHFICDSCFEMHVLSEIEKPRDRDVQVRGDD